MPISCDFYDQLELAAMRRQAVRLTFKDTEGKLSHYEGLIADLKTDKGAEFLITENKKSLPLEGLIQIEQTS